jgi:hypothetical protein
MCGVGGFGNPDGATEPVELWFKGKYSDGLPPVPPVQFSVRAGAFSIFSDAAAASADSLEAKADSLESLAASWFCQEAMKSPAAETLTAITVKPSSLFVIFGFRTTIQAPTAIKSRIRPATIKGHVPLEIINHFTLELRAGNLSTSVARETARSVV